jgi:hypothetical protein
LVAFLDPIRFPDSRPSFGSFITNDYFKNQAVFGAGPLWFIETLLIFSALYMFWRLLRRPRQDAPDAKTPFPGNGAIALFACILGVAAFLIRIWLPVGWNFVLLNLQFPFFIQYIALFAVGVIANRRNWLLSLPANTGRFWLRVSFLLIILFWPIVLCGGALHRGLDPFRGGLQWQALAYALWESFLCIGMCVSLIHAFRRFGNRQGKLPRFLSRNAYTAYLIHEVVIIAFAYAVRDVALYPLLKWAAVSLLAVPLCFVLSIPIRRIPGADRVL